MPRLSVLAQRPVARRALPRLVARPSCELVQDSARVVVRLKRPLGLVLAEREGGEGVLVESTVPGGHGEQGGVQAGDWLLSVDGADVAYASFDGALDALAAGAPAAAELELERTVFAAVEADAASGAAAYWAAKRAAKALPVAALRNTVQGLVSHKELKLVGGALGGGSFGAVFEADWSGCAVVLKRANERVVGAVEALEAELRLNEIVAARAPGACAAFLGCVDVPSREAGELYNKRLTAGLWLLFSLESRVTLAALLSNPEAVAEALRVPRARVVRAAGAALLRALAALHAAGIVHRDVKPCNLLVCADAATLRLIDLGASASCLTPHEVINYEPGVGACDPLYCEPDDAGWPLPADADAPTAANLQALWERHRPDRVDVYAAGLTLLQLATPSLRSDSSLRAFRLRLAALGGDLLSWRQETGAVAELDEEGWRALAALLAPRERRVSAAAAAAMECWGS